MNLQRYEYTAAAPGVAVFSEIYYPKGWTAYLDGVRSALFPRDYVLRAMVLPAGTHSVEFRFRAPHYELLSSLTLISSLLLLGGVAAVAGAAGYRAYKKRKDNDGTTIRGSGGKSAMPNVISTVSIALVLFLLGSVGYLILGAMGATQRLEESMTVYVMLRDDVTPEASEALSKKLSANEAVREVHFIGKDAAAEEFKEYLGDDFVEFLEQNPLPDSYELRLNAGASDKETISALEKEVSQWEGVAEVVYQRGVLEQIGRISISSI